MSLGVLRYEIKALLLLYVVFDVSGKQRIVVRDQGHLYASVER